MRKILSMVLLISIVAVSVVGCGNSSQDISQPDSSSDGTPKQGGTIVVGISADPQSFNPNAKADDIAFDVGQNIFSRLIKLNNNQELVPDLAETYTVSDDGKEITFNLRKGVKWHDGEPFTSKDVKWTFDQIIKENGQIKSNLASVESIEAPDDYTVIFKLTQNDSNLLSYLG